MSRNSAAPPKVWGSDLRVATEIASASAGPTHSFTRESTDTSRRELASVASPDSCPVRD